MSDHALNPTVKRHLAVLGRGRVPADTPILRADDLGALRGDGIFETMHVRDGKPWMFSAHMDRMTGSAVRLSLDLPDREALAELAEQALDGWPPDVEAALRVVCTRGPEPGGPVTVYATVTPVGAAAIRARRDGVTVATASLGYPADARQRAPWLLGGAKTLSYAVNMASQRWAASQGVDDVLWMSADGYALEGPTSTLLWLTGTSLCTVPAARTGILAGTTARELLEHAGAFGWTAAEEMITPERLRDVDGVWFSSSIRGLVAIRQIDGHEIAVSGDTARMSDLLGFTA